MHCRTFYRQRRGDRALAEASEATGISRGTLSRVERGEQFPKAEQCRRLAEFYDAETARVVASFVTLKTRPDVYLTRLYGVGEALPRTALNLGFPPRYTELIGAQLLQHIQSERAA